jgi:hypothetical protein
MIRFTLLSLIPYRPGHLLELGPRPPCFDDLRHDVVAEPINHPPRYLGTPLRPNTGLPILLRPLPPLIEPPPGAL